MSIFLHYLISNSDPSSLVRRLQGRYTNIGNVGMTASMSMLTLFESRYTLKGRYNIGNVGRLLL